MLDITHGGDGYITFTLPDFRGRVPMHYGNQYTQDDAGGYAISSVQVENLQVHNNHVTAIVEEGDSSLPMNNYPAKTKLLDKEDRAISNRTFSYMCKRTLSSKKLDL